MLIRPHKLNDESDAGYVLRCAQRNGLLDPTWLMTTSRGRHTRMRCCPACIEVDRPYWREVWVLDPPLCAAHDHWLVDECAECGRAVSLKTARLTSCRCGALWTNMTQRAVPTATVDVIRNGCASAETLLWLGSLSKHGLQGKPQKKAAQRSVKVISELLDQGAKMVADWPDSFDCMLSSLRIDGGTSGSLTLLNAALPTLTKRVAHIKETAWRERVSEALLSHVVASRAGPSPLIGRNAPAALRVKDVAMRLKMSSSRVRVALGQLPDVPTRVTTAGRRRISFTALHEARLREEREDHLSAKGAARELGVSVLRLHALATSGILSVQGGQFRRSDVSTLAQSVQQQATTLACLSSGAKPLQAALRLLVPRPMTAPFMIALQRGELHVFQCNPSAGLLGGLAVQHDEVCTWVKAQTGRAAEALMSLTQASQALALKPEVVSALVRRGLLRTVRKRTGRREASFVEPSELASFQQRYVPLIELARASGVSSKQAPVWAAGMGIALVCGPSIDGTRQYIAYRPLEHRSKSNKGERDA
jgi:hypothetical protein